VDGRGPIDPYPDEYRYVWRWNGQRWQADPPTPMVGVPYQFYHSMCFDSARNALVVFGGQNMSGSPVTNYTYEILYQNDPVVLEQPTVKVSLLGQQVQLSVLAAGAPPISYAWQKEGINLTDASRISGSTNDSLTINATIASDSGHYQVVLSNLCGGATSRPIQLVVTTTPLSIATSSANIIINWTDTSATLETAPSLSGPWATVAGATSPYIAVRPAGTAFFRLIH
jgi:hypothetical protein